MSTTRQYYDDGSRSRFYREGQQLTFEEVQLGCLQRIASATELMAKNHDVLVRQRDWYKRSSEDLALRNDQLKRQLAAARGQVTRLRNKYRDVV